MKTLWTFGASQTEGFTSSHKWASNYVKWKGYTPKVFGQIISEKLGYEFNNLGIAGVDNFTILETYCNNIKKIDETDIVIICWTDVVRFRLAINDNWEIFTADTTESTFEDFPVDFLTKCLVNRYENKLYTEEINNFIDFISHTSKCKIINWTDFYGNLKCTKLLGFQTINEETNGILKDPHYSEKGHIDLSKKLLNLIENNTNKFLI